jgi:hypothetical protein
VVGSCEYSNETLGSIKCGEQLPSQEGLYSMDLIGLSVRTGLH